MKGKAPVTALTVYDYAMAKLVDRCCVPLMLVGDSLGMVVLVGLSWAFFSHMMSGLRHFVMDIGAGYELDTNKTWSILAPLLGILLTAGFWALILLR